jgi:hypothetical protein
MVEFTSYSDHKNVTAKAAHRLVHEPIGALGVPKLVGLDVRCLLVAWSR